MLPPPLPAASKLQSRETDSEISTQHTGCGGRSVAAALSPPPRILSCRREGKEKSGFIQHEKTMHGEQSVGATGRIEAPPLTSMFIWVSSERGRGARASRSPPLQRCLDATPSRLMPGGCSTSLRPVTVRPRRRRARRKGYVG